jgi:hypothetical protein
MSYNCPFERYNSMEFTDEIFGARILETITDGLYSGNLNAIREYIQNSIDEGAKKIDIRFENGNSDLVIVDDGNGMSKIELEDSVKLGKSSKGEDQIGWRGIGIYSGVSASEKLVIITKKCNSPKLRLEMNNGILGTARRSTRTAASVLQEAISDVEELELGKDESYKKDHYTIIRLETILPTQAGTFTKGALRDYLSKIVPASFDYSKVPKLKEVDDWLETNGAKPQQTQIFFDGVQIFRPPFDLEKYYENPIFHIFSFKNQKIALAWFLTNRDNKELTWPYGGIFFKKKGMTIGDEKLIRQYYTGQYNVWQYGEIHIISSEIYENAGRNGFEYNTQFLQFLDQVKEFLKNLQNVNRYKSATVKINKLNILKRTYEGGDISRAKSLFKQITDVGVTRRTVTSESSFQIVKEAIDEHSRIVDKEITEFGTAIGERESTIARAELQKAKEDLQRMINNLPSPVKKSVKRSRGEGLLNPVNTVADSIEDLLRKKTGENPDKFIELIQRAYGWGGVTKRKKVAPILWIHNIEEKNLRFGVMVYTFYDLIINEFKHEKGKEVLKWLENTSEIERYKVMTEIVAVMGLLYRLIDHSSKRRPQLLSEP